MPSVRQILAQTVITTIPVGLLIVSPVGDIMAASPSAENLLGQPPSSLEGQAWQVLLRPEPVNDAFNRALTEAVTERRSFRRTLVEYERPDGEARLFSLTASSSRTGEKLVGVTLLIDDVTALYRSRGRELAVLREKNRLQYDMIESLNNLALSVAHQIRNPVAAIGGFSMKLLRDHKERHLPTEYPDIIFQEARRLEDIVEAVVRLASLPHPTFGEVPMRALVEEAVIRAGDAATARHRQVAWALSLNDVSIVADRSLLGQAVYEILCNAVEAADDETARVAVDLSIRDDGVVLAVTDNGPGIREDLRPFVFDPFFTTKPRGAGIGLALARKAVFEHNGEITFRCGDAGGTTVLLRLFDTPEAGLAKDGFDAPSGLDVRGLKAKARQLGIDISGFTTIDAVRAVQQGEGFAPCFAWGIYDRCGQELCAFRRECIKTMRIDEARRITYGGG